MSIRELFGSGAPNAYVFYFSRHQKPEEWVGWMVLCYPLHAAYVRALRPEEALDYLAPRYGAGYPRYGLFNQFSGSCLMLGHTIGDVVRVAYQLNRVPVLVH